MYLFVAAYAVACLVVIFMEKNVDSGNIDESYWFSERMVADAKLIQEAECIWLTQTGDSAKFCVVDGFAEEEHITIDGATLEKLLNPRFYINQNDNVALGMFFPLVMVSYNANNMQINVVYSFMNAEARVFADGEFVRAAALYEANVLQNLFDNL